MSAPVALVSGIYHFRNVVSANLAFGTSKPLTQDISIYNKLMISNFNGIIAAFRTGTPNNSSTAINTATVLQSGSANNMALSMGKSKPYLVIGNQNTYPRYNLKPDPGSISINYSADITEIYLE